MSGLEHVPATTMPDDAEKPLAPPGNGIPGDVWPNPHTEDCTILLPPPDWPARHRAARSAAPSWAAVKHDRVTMEDEGAEV